VTAAGLRLPRADGSVETFTLRPPREWPRPAGPARSRAAFAAAHVVADPRADNTPGSPAALDWDATMAYRRHLWSYGLGVADAMDTAQRGMGLDWPATRELISRSAAESRSCGGLLACGAGTDHVGAVDDIDAVLAAYEHQVSYVESAGATVVLMASRQLVAVASDADDYAKVYGRVLEQVTRPVILHWLGQMFDPALAGYWGSPDIGTATDTFVSIVRQHADVIDGVKVSLLDAEHEVALRDALPDGVRLYTGDDFNYPDLIRGDARGYSHALLGAFDAIAPAASTALQALDAGDLTTYDEVLAPTLPLARHLFAAPTYYYKTGIVFLAWLAGQQAAFTLVGGLASGRSLTHLCDVLRLADAAGLLPDPDLAAARMRAFLTVGGVPQ
jgi:Protein of unknown function (DUF993)